MEISQNDSFYNKINSRKTCKENFSRGNSDKSWNPGIRVR